MSEITEGTIAYVVARDGTRTATVRWWSVPIYKCAAYVARRRKDGVMTWRRDDSLLGSAGRGVRTVATRCPTSAYETEVNRAAEADGALPMSDSGIRRGTVVS